MTSKTAASHLSNKSRNDQDHKKIEVVASYDITKKNILVILYRGYHIHHELWCRSAKSHNGETNSQV